MRKMLLCITFIFFTTTYIYAESLSKKEDDIRLLTNENINFIIGHYDLLSQKAKHIFCELVSGKDYATRLMPYDNDLGKSTADIKVTMHCMNATELVDAIKGLKNDSYCLYCAVSLMHSIDSVSKGFDDLIDGNYRGDYTEKSLAQMSVELVYYAYSIRMHVYAYAQIVDNNRHANNE